MGRNTSFPATKWWLPLCAGVLRSDLPGGWVPQLTRGGKAGEGEAWAASGALGTEKEHLHVALSWEAWGNKWKEGELVAQLRVS